jgi:hypothetical protein
MVLIASPCVAAIVISYFAKNKYSRLLLFYAGTFFASVIALSIIVENQCGGSLLKGLGMCTPKTLEPLFHAMHLPLFVLVPSYLFLGPLAVLLAIGFEVHHRLRP